jgi:hypothetical protein
MPACPNPAILTPRVQTPNCAMVAFISSFTVGVACNGWPPSPTSSPGPFRRASPHLLVLCQVTHNITTPHLARSIGRVEMYLRRNYRGKRTPQTKLSATSLDSLDPPEGGASRNGVV